MGRVLQETIDRPPPRPRLLLSLDGFLDLRGDELVTALAGLGRVFGDTPAAAFMTSPFVAIRPVTFSSSAGIKRSSKTGAAPWIAPQIFAGPP